MKLQGCGTGWWFVRLVANSGMGMKAIGIQTVVGWDVNLNPVVVSPMSSRLVVIDEPEPDLGSGHGIDLIRDDNPVFDDYCKDLGWERSEENPKGRRRFWK